MEAAVCVCVCVRVLVLGGMVNGVVCGVAGCECVCGAVESVVCGFRLYIMYESKQKGGAAA